MSRRPMRPHIRGLSLPHSRLFKVGRIEGGGSVGNSIVELDQRLTAVEGDRGYAAADRRIVRQDRRDVVAATEMDEVAALDEIGDDVRTALGLRPGLER